MARYVARARTSLPVPEAFDLVADMRRFVEWDPGIRSAVQVDGDGAGHAATFDLRVAGFPLDFTLRYVTEEYDAPTSASHARHARHVARHSVFTSVDRVSASRDGDGTVVVYDAELRLNGPLRIGDLGLRPVFAWVGGRADSGLRRALDVESVAA